MLKHKQETKSKGRFKALRTGRRR